MLGGEKKPLKVKFEVDQGNSVALGQASFTKKQMAVV